ncbi:MAG: YqgE/AlgH family protein [Adhaeribacter sp.]
MKKIRSGTILISEPYMGDPNFERTVVLVCRHDEEGSFGLVLNRKSNLKLSDVLDVFQQDGDMELSIGGPMEYNTLHYIHQLDKLQESIPLSQSVFWGGDYEQLKEFLSSGLISPDEIRFFLGYSGWSPGQLQEEIDNKIWIVNNTATDLLFDLNQDSLWREILKQMGGKYKVLANYPIDPSLN